MRVTIEYSGLRDVRGRFVRIAETDRAVMSETVREATEMIYQQALANAATMFKNPEPMQSALRVVFDRVGSGERGQVSLHGIAAVTQELGGTRPYEILPRAGRALKFEGRLFSDEAVVFASRVMHPALPARSFLRSALEEKRAEIQALFADRVRAGMRG